MFDKKGQDEGSGASWLVIVILLVIIGLALLAFILGLGRLGR